MNQSVPNRSPNHDPKKPGWGEQLLQKIASYPRKVTIGIGVMAACGFLGYWIIDYLVKKKLPPLLESQICKIIERPIDLGEVKGFSLNSIEFGSTSLPAKATDSDLVLVEKVKVRFKILSVIFRRTLPLDISLIQPDVYLEQEKDGEWLDLDFLRSKKEQKEPLIYFDVDLDVEQADITAVPYNQSPIEVRVNASGSYEGTGEQLVTYDLEAAINKSKATIKGETRVATGQTNTKLLVKDLALADVSTLLSNSPDIKESLYEMGNFNAMGKIEGTINNPKVVVDWQLPAANTAGVEDISGEGKLLLTGEQLQLKDTKIAVDTATAEVTGKADLTNQQWQANVDAADISSSLRLAKFASKNLAFLKVVKIKAQTDLNGSINWTLAGKLGKNH